MIGDFLSLATLVIRLPLLSPLLILRCFQIGSTGLRYIYRLVVVLDDDSVIPLTRGFSGLYDKKIDRIVDQIREYLGHVVALH